MTEFELLSAGAELLHTLDVSSDGRVSSCIETSVADCDVTGGIARKLKAAYDIVRHGRGRSVVLLCCLDGSSFEEACLCGVWQADSAGTRIQFKHDG